MSKLAEKLNKSFNMSERYPYTVINAETKEEVLTVYFKTPSLSSARREINKFQSEDYKNIPDSVLLIVERAYDEAGKPAFGPEDYNALCELPLEVVLDMYNFSNNPSKTTVESLKK